MFLKILAHFSVLLGAHASLSDLFSPDEAHDSFNMKEFTAVIDESK